VPPRSEAGAARAGEVRPLPNCESLLGSTLYPSGRIPPGGRSCLAWSSPVWRSSPWRHPSASDRTASLSVTCLPCGDREPIVRKRKGSESTLRQFAVARSNQFASDPDQSCPALHTEHRLLPPRHCVRLLRAIRSYELRVHDSTTLRTVGNGRVAAAVIHVVAVQ
jgi:hypothetical protein